MANRRDSISSKTCSSSDSDVGNSSFSSIGSSWNESTGEAEVFQLSGVEKTTTTTTTKQSPPRWGFRFDPLRMALAVLALVHVCYQSQGNAPTRGLAVQIENQVSKEDIIPSAIQQNVPLQRVAYEFNSTTLDRARRRPPYRIFKRRLKAGDLTAGQPFLDFAILGHGKCGTTTLMRWLGDHPETSVFPGEITMMQRNPTEMIKRLSMQLSPGPQLWGYKSPSDAGNARVARAYRENFPETKLIIGMRHPVRWFESLYNFRVQNGSVMPATWRMHPLCARGQKSVCAIRAAFHNNLQVYGKTNMTDEEEMGLFTSFDDRHLVHERAQYVPNRIFLYDSTQLGDDNVTRVENLRTDLQNHIGLRSPLPNPPFVKPGRTVSEEQQRLRDARKIDICQRAHASLRKQLVEIGKNASEWISNYFLESPDVTVSNREHFLSIMESYGRDPCDEESSKSLPSMEGELKEE